MTPFTVRLSSEAEIDFSELWLDSTDLVRHPLTEEVLIVIEVSDTSLESDRTSKLEMYARDKIPVCWIVNLIDRRVEVLTLPRSGRKRTDRQRKEYTSGESIPVVLNGTEIGTIAVDAILPSQE
jgi:hypothetical protein